MPQPNHLAPATDAREPRPRRARPLQLTGMPVVSSRIASALATRGEIARLISRTIALRYLQRKGGKGSSNPLFFQLLMPSGRPLDRARGEKNLDLGLREYHGSHVAAIRHQTGGTANRRWRSRSAARTTGSAATLEASVPGLLRYESPLSPPGRRARRLPPTPNPSQTACQIAPAKRANAGRRRGLDAARAPPGLPGDTAHHYRATTSPEPCAGAADGALA